LVKNKKFCTITSSGSPNPESITEVSRRRKIAILIVPSWKVQVWSSLLKNLTISTIPGKAMKKRDLQLPPGSLNAHLLRNASYGYKAKTFEFSTHMKKEKENIADHVTFRQ
jgi:hypothetical protein